MAERVGRYEIIGELGAGGMGVVYRARDPRVDREVAIKMLPPELDGDPGRRARFEREARAAGALNHPNVLTLHDVGEHEGAPYLVTELLEGQTVRAMLDAGPLPVDDALSIAGQIARGLDAAHRREVVHRDIKPSNLFVCDDGVVKILDFGIARATASSKATETDSGAVLGTSGYMAPEQIRGREIDGRADLFALGVVLHEMVAGARPFSGETDVDVAVAILHDQPASSGDPRIDAITRRCLAKEPGDRYASAAALLDGLRPGEPPPRRRRRWPLLAALAAAAAVAAVATLATREAPSLAIPRPKPPPTEPRETRLTSLSERDWPISVMVARDASVFAYGNREAVFIQRPGVARARRIARPQGVDLMLPTGFFPDGRRLLVAIVRSNSAEIAILDTVDDSLVPVRDRLTNSGRLSPDGKRAVIIDERQPDTLQVLDLESGATRELFLLSRPEDAWLAHAWSPDSRAIAIVWGRVEANAKPSTLWVVDVDGGVRSRRRVPIEGDLVQPGGIYGVAWSEPGRLVYGQAADNGTGGELWEVGIDGSDPRRLRAWPDATVDWLDVVDGRLFFMKNRVQTDVYVGQLTAEGLATPERFSDSQSTDVFVGWSSDGRVLFSSDRNGTFDLFAGRPESDAVKLVAGGPGDEFGVGVEGGLVLWRRAPEGDCRLWFEPDGGGEPRPLLSRPRCDWGGRATDAPPSIACATRRPDRCVLAESRDSEVVFSAVDPASGEVRELYRHRAAEVGGLPVDVAADGGRAVFALRDPPAIATIDLDSGAVARHPFDLPGGLGVVALRGDDGGFITLPTWWTAGLLWLRPDGTHTQLWDRGIDRLRRPRVSPDGRHLGVTYIETETNVWVVDGLFGP